MTGENHMAFRDRRLSRHSVHSSNSRGLPRPIRAYTTAGTEISARNRQPTTGRASAVRSPRFGNAKVRVAVAWMHGSAGSLDELSAPALGIVGETVANEGVDDETGSNGRFLKE